MRRLLLQLFAVALLSLPSAHAAARGRPARPAAAKQVQAQARQAQAQARTEEGLKLYEAQRWQEAYEKLRQAQELQPSQTRLLFMARCQHRLGKLLEARALYDQILSGRLPPNAPDKAIDERAEAQKELEIVRVRTPRVKLVLTGIAAKESRVFVDGVRVLAWDRELELNPGQHTIEVTSAGAETLVRTFTVNQGRSKTITLVRRIRAAQARSSS